MPTENIVCFSNVLNDFVSLLVGVDERLKCQLNAKKQTCQML